MPNTNFTPIVVETGGNVVIPGGTPTPPSIPRLFTPRAEEKYISFVLEIKGNASDASLEKIKEKINQKLATKLSGYFPELLFFSANVFQHNKNWIKTRKFQSKIYKEKKDYAKIFDDLKIKKYPELPFELERLFPGSENDFKNAKKFKLDKFLHLTLPIFERQFERRTTSAQMMGDLFEAAYVLNEITEVLEVSPTNRFNRYELLSSGCPSGPDLAQNWPLSNMNATNLPNAVDGSGIVIGHPDSGWTPHSKLNFTNVSTNPVSPSFDLARDWNVFNDANTAEESLATNAFTKFHGTATSSVIISQSADLKGIAQGAKVLPIRTISELGISGTDTGVALIGDTDVARAVWYAIQKNVDIISLSLGGFPMPALECVIAHAVYNNIVVVAAGGQYNPFLIFPSGYPECIAVSASNIDNEPWEHAFKHSKIAISAPGENVACADWNDQSPNRREIICRNANGTSFSTAYVAGVAALWLEKFGKQNLINGLNGRATLQELFLAHMERTATVPANWNTDKSGAGIVNVGRLLRNDTLPNLTTFRGRDWNNWARRTHLELLYMMYEDSDPVVLRERFQNFLNTDDNETIEAIGQEIINIFMKVQGAVEDFTASVEAVGDDAEEFIEDAVEAVKDVASEVVGTVAGWFS